MQRAALLAQQMNAEVFFVHAVNDSLAGRVLRSKVNRAYARLAFQSEHLIKHAPEDAMVAVQLGKPVDVVIAAAREYRPDLIVLARPNRRRLDAIVGTTAERIIRGTDCSLLLVSNPVVRAYERVTLAADVSSTSEHVTNSIVNMGMLNNALIQLASDTEQPELLVVGVSRWFALKRILASSAAHRVLRAVNCDVLAIAPPAAERKWLQAA